MPWWVVAYFAAYAIFAAFGVRDDIKEAHPLWFTIGDVSNAVFLVLIALAYWLPSVGQLLQPIAVIMYCLSVAWLMVVFRIALKGKLPNPSYSLRGNLLLGTGFTVLLACIAGPLYWWGFQYAVLGKASGT